VTEVPASLTGRHQHARTVHVLERDWRVVASFSGDNQDTSGGRAATGRERPARRVGCRQSHPANRPEPGGDPPHGRGQLPPPPGI